MGSAAAYNLVIYNAQKAYQVVIPLTAKFQYTLQNMYVSFTDPQGLGWSALFESVDVLATWQRVLMAVLAHVASYSDVDPSVPGFLKTVTKELITFKMANRSLYVLHM